jgi:hypothetical protein
VIITVEGVRRPAAVGTYQRDIAACNISRNRDVQVVAQFEDEADLTNSTANLHH